jgi:hypothetical protein
METGEKVVFGGLAAIAGTFILYKVAKASGGTHKQFLTAGMNEVVYTGQRFKGKKIYDSIGEYIVGIVVYRLPDWGWWDDVTEETVIYNRSIIRIRVSEDCLLEI